MGSFERAPAQTPLGCQVVPVQRWCNGAVCDAQDAVAQEVPVALEFNGLSHAVMLATPADLEDFALGFSLTEGLVDHLGQVHDLEIDRSAQGITVALTVASACFARFKDRRRSMAGRTGCGLCGAENLAQALRPTTELSASVSTYSPEAVLRGMNQLRSHQALLAATGATHAAAWCDAQGQLHALREDVGRHNALDKLIGALLRPASPWLALGPQAGFVVVSSRASHEMVQKTAAAGIALMAAVSGVTALAIDTAARSGLCLVGFARPPQFSVYTHCQRLATECFQ
jgi:FdhD protein